MASILPLQGILYNPAVVGDIRNVVAPPYDVIDAATQRALYERHPQNIVRLELGLDESGDGPTSNKYTRAAAWLSEWLRTGVLRRDSQPAVYYHTIEYRPPASDPDGSMRTLKGFLATAELEEFGTGRIYPHENTRAAAKTDRLNLLEACQANFSPIWALYSDPDGSIIALLERAVQADKPRIEFQDDAGFRQRLWAVTDPAVLDQLVAAMKPKPLFIADGHHRYETALTYRRLRRERAGASPSVARQPYDSVLMLFAGLEDPGLTVLPTHRVLSAAVPPVQSLQSLLGEAFEFLAFPFNSADEPAVRRRFLQTLRERGQSAAPSFYRLSPRPVGRLHSPATGDRQTLPDASRTGSHPLHQRRRRGARLGSPRDRGNRAAAQSDESRRSPGRGVRRRTDAAQVDLFLPQAADRASDQRHGGMKRWARG